MQTKKRLQKLLIGAMLLIVVLMLISCKRVELDNDTVEEDVMEEEAMEDKAMEEDTMADEISTAEKSDVRKLLEKESQKRMGIITGMVTRVASSAECMDVKLDIIEEDGNEELCLYKSTLTIGIANEGDTVINGVTLYIDSEKEGEIPIKIKGLINPGSTATNFIGYNSDIYGGIDKIKIVPIIELSGRESICEGKSITRKNVGECS